MSNNYVVTNWKWLIHDYIRAQGGRMLMVVEVQSDNSLVSK